jgi:hypothetical protein
VIAEAEEDRFPCRKITCLVNGVTVTLLRVLHGEANARCKILHPARLIAEVGIFFKAPEVFFPGAMEVRTDGAVLIGLHDQADFLYSGIKQFDEMVMEESAADAVGADNREEFLLHRMGSGEVAGA